MQEVSEEQMASVTNTGVLFGTNAPPLVPALHMAVHTPNRRVWIIAGMLEHHLIYLRDVNRPDLQEEEQEEEDDPRGGAGQQDPTDKHDDASSGGAAGVLVQ